ncbi:MAG: asparagine synthase-related protein, partial [Allosphingosinicella sp.]
MTLLAALWHRDGRPAARACKTMLQAQSGDTWRRLVREAGGAALGAAVRNASPEEALVESDSGLFSLLADARLDNRRDFLPHFGLAAASDVSDARLMLLCFERWGVDVISRFVGDFALALWDRRAERLLLARDFAGQRPLHFHEGARSLAVASMAKGLHALDFVPRAVNRTRMLETLASLPHEGRSTFFKDVERVEPGEVLTFRHDGRAARTFWTAPTGEIRFQSDAEYAEALLDKLDAAVASRLRDAGETVGCHLSAGLDSSAVMGSAADRFAGRVLAFTSVPPDELPSLPFGRFGNEGVLAAETAAMYANVEHHLIPIESRLPLEDIEWELALFERPDLNLPNLAWTNGINDAAQAAGIEVMLVGTTGNATISYGGFEVLGELLARRRWASFLSEGAAALGAGVRARTLLAQASRQILPRRIVRALGRLRNRKESAAISGVINPAAAGVDEVIARSRLLDDRAALGSAATRIRMLTRVDPGTYNKGVLLRWGIDLRDPTADRLLAEYCLQVPLTQYFRHGRTRALIRTALKGRVPEAVRCETRRGLQSPHWFSMLSRARGEAAR